MTTNLPDALTRLRELREKAGRDSRPYDHHCSSNCPCREENDAAQWLYSTAPDLARLVVELAEALGASRLFIRMEDERFDVDEDALPKHMEMLQSQRRHAVALTAAALQHVQELVGTDDA